MVFKNIASQKLAVYAYDIANEEAKTGDSANITCQLSIDGATSVALTDTNPTELDATNHPGIYIFDLTLAETNGNMLIFSSVSATSNIVIEPVIVYTEAAILSDGAGTLATSLGTSGGLVRGVDTDSLEDVSDAVLDELIGDSTVTMRQALRGFISVLAGKSTGGGTTSITFRNVADSKDVIVATVDENGNRSAVTLDL